MFVGGVGVVAVGVIDTGAVDKGVVDKGTIEAGIVDTGVVSPDGSVVLPSATYHVERVSELNMHSSITGGECIKNLHFKTQ